MRISDWSSDVCSSDLPDGPRLPAHPVRQADRRPDARARHGRGAGPSAQAGGIRPDKARAERPCLDIPRGLRACLAQTRAAASPVTWMRISTGAVIIGTRLTRSEEHTSELQSLMRISY